MKNKYEVKYYLKPCPFCGSPHIDPKGVATQHTVGPACDDCSATTNFIGNEELDAKAWNMRVITV